MTADRKKTPDSADFRKVYPSRGNGGGDQADRPRGGTRAPNCGRRAPERNAEIVELVDAVRALPDVRLDKVAAIRQAIESGTYVVDSLKVAEKMLEEIRVKRSADSGWRS